MRSLQRTNNLQGAIYRRDLLKGGAALGALALTRCGRTSLVNLPDAGIQRDAVLRDAALPDADIQRDAVLRDAALPDADIQKDTAPLNCTLQGVLNLADFYFAQPTSPYIPGIALIKFVFEKPLISFKSATGLTSPPEKIFDLTNESVQERAIGPGGWYYITHQKGSVKFQEIVQSMISDLENDFSLGVIPAAYQPQCQQILCYLKTLL